MKISSTMTVVDTKSLFDGSEMIAKARRCHIKVDYKVLLDRLNGIRTAAGMAPSGAVAVAEVNPISDRQAGFVKALREIGYVVDAVDFRLTSYVDKRGHASGIGIGVRIAYILGLLAANPEAEIVVVSNDFFLAMALQNVMKRCKCILTFPDTLIDSRWATAKINVDKSLLTSDIFISSSGADVSKPVEPVHVIDTELQFDV